jgi:sialate O-acetylesterase
MQIQGSNIYVSFEVGKASLAPLGKSLGNFSVSGKDRVFYPASARVVGKNMVVVGAEQVSDPVAVRYCFDGTSVGTLFNNYGVPASPFRTDKWELISTQNN